MTWLKLFQKDDMYGHDVLILRLKITACNGHDMLICGIVNMTSHGGSIGNTFDAIGHDPGMLKISTRLYLPN